VGGGVKAVKIWVRVLKYKPHVHYFVNTTETESIRPY
jgi:hypothetical protein